MPPTTTIIDHWNQTPITRSNIKKWRFRDDKGRFICKRLWEQIWAKRVMNTDQVMTIGGQVYLIIPGKGEQYAN